MISQNHECSRKIYTVGLFRTGSNSLYEIFRREFRAAHEFMLRPIWAAIQSYVSREISRADFIECIKHRETEGNLEMDAAGFNFFYVDILLGLRPDAKFILTLRDAYSWVNSCIDALLSKRQYDAAQTRFIGQFINNIEHLADNQFEWVEKREDRICVEQLVKLWATANTFLLRAIPPERLLVLYTDSLSDSIHEIAPFIGVSENELSTAHANAGRGLNYLACFDPRALERIFAVHASELMTERFPGMTLSAFMQSGRVPVAANPVDVLPVFTLSCRDGVDAASSVPCQP